MENRLGQCAALAQKDKAAAYLALLADILAQQNDSSMPHDLHKLLDAVVNNDAVGIVVGRQVLSELANNLSASVADPALRMIVVQVALNTVQSRIASYEEQVNSLRFQYADLLEAEEDWSSAARILMGISLESGQRSIPDGEKLRIYIRIVRLLLEDEDSVQAETFYNRAALLAHAAADRETQLQFKLCQARISDYARKFLEAALRYHELSWVAAIDEDERSHMLSAAVTCAVLAPAGPNRSRVLAALYRDERAAALPTYNVLSKMFLDHILRAAEVRDFERTLKPHQLARLAPSSNDQLASAPQAADPDDADAADAGASARTGPATVLDRAVMEHNLLACAALYANISFRGLGALLGLAPGAAETMARRMIEQGRLRASIDQVARLIWFDAPQEEGGAQGRAGGLGDVEQDTEDTGAPFTKRWDMQIRTTAANVEAIVQHLTEKGLLRPPIAVA